MTTEASFAYLDSPEATQAFAVLHRAAQDALGGVVGQQVTAVVNGRRATGASDVAQLSKNVLIEVQFERPLEVHHSIVVLASGAELIPFFALTPSDDAAEILGAESLLTLGDIVSTFLDTLTGELLWLQPTPRAWLANLEPVAVDANGVAHVDLPAMVAADGPLYLVDLILTNSDGASCEVQLVYSERTEQTLLGLDSGAAEEPLALPEEPLFAASDPTPVAAPPIRDEAAPARSPAPVQPVQFKPLGPEQLPGRSNGIDLIRDVPLHVSVELGRASLTVRDILALGVGSVVELDRLAGEPVDVLVNDRLIGRGEVVIVDESFGVRLTEIFRESSRRSG